MEKRSDRNGSLDLKVAGLWAALCIAIGIFIFSLFGNIQYPLLWNDEGETVMYAKRILQYGYPKIHDGKNTVWLTENPDKQKGIDLKHDSPAALVWGQYYFAAIGAFFAEMTDDLYLKTALLRIPFAIAGFAGLCIMALSVIGLFRQSISRALAFLALFFSFSALSVTLPIHLREARHPPLVVFLSACIFAAYFSYRFQNRIRYTPYFLILIGLFLILYNIFHVICFIFIATLGLWECIMALKERSVKLFLKNTAPIATVFFLTVPFFLTSPMMAAGEDTKKMGSHAPWSFHLASLLRSMQKHEFFYLVLTASAILFITWAYSVKLGSKPELNTSRKLQISSIFSLFFIIYACVISLFPSAALYERYYVVLQPVMTMILLLNIFCTLELFSQLFPASRADFFKTIYIAILVLTFFLNIGNKLDHLEGHMYEITHRYKGPLDYVIPFIKEHYKNPEDLVIATNYEELCYMYYLGSKVIVGYVGNNMEEDMKMRPDILIYRKKGSFVGSEPFVEFLRRDKYKKVIFPVYDYPVNNLPDRINHWNIHHLYRTPETNDQTRCLDIFLREGINK